MLVLEIKTNNLYSWRGIRVLVPRHQKSGAPQEYNNLFVLISKAIIRIFVFSLFLNFFICPWYFLILLKHCQHKQDGNKEKRPKNRLGTGALVPQCSCFFTLCFSIPQSLQNVPQSAPDHTRKSKNHAFGTYFLFGPRLTTFLGQIQYNPDSNLSTRIQILVLG